jgi:pyruvate oxidase
MNTCEVLLSILAGYGVNRIYGIPGDAINNIVEAIRKQDQIKFILVRHEEAGALAASAHAKLTGKLGVCMGTSGPGAIHLLNGLYDAKMDHAPVLAISGQTSVPYLGTDNHQEVDFNMLFKDVSVFNQTILNPHQMPHLAVQACMTALAKRGVAHISIPMDISSMEIPGYKNKQYIFISDEKSIPGKQSLMDAAQVLNEAEKVAILIGIGAKKAMEQVTQVANILQSPIIRSLRGKEIIHDDHPFCIGGIGMLGGKPASHAIENADALLMIGSDFPYPEFYPKKRIPVVQLDIEPYQIGKRYPVEIGLVGEADLTLNALIPQLTQKSTEKFLKEGKKEMEHWLKKEAEKENSEHDPIHPQSVAYLAGEMANDDAIFLCDTGTVTVWGARNLHLRKKQRFVISGALASMAFAMPAAIGAQLEFPDKQVIAFCGDGGFHMLMGDFITAVKYGLPIKVIIFNNHKLGLIQLEQEVMGNPQYQVELTNPDYAEFAKLCGGDGIHVSKFDQLRSAIKTAYESKLPFIINVDVNPEELVMPPEIHFNMMTNYAKSKIREALGQGDK